MPAELLYVSAHDIHAHPATRELGDLLCRGKTREHEQIDDFLITECRGLRLRHQLSFEGFLAYFCAVDATTVVRNNDVDLAALVKRRNSNMPGHRLSQSRAFIGFLDSVVNGISHHVRE